MLGRELVCRNLPFTKIGTKIFVEVCIMEKIVEKLDNINKTLEEILAVMQTPQSTINKVLEYGGAGVSILGILSIIDIIRNWIMGG
jgi:hypothetical protein